MEKVKILITEMEWMDSDKEVRSRIIELMKENGYDTATLEELEDESKGPKADDIFNQFYGDEE